MTHPRKYTASRTNRRRLIVKRALLSDIHSNLEALDAVLADIRQQGIREIYCLGDLVGYGANPSECIQLIRERVDVVAISGNHDRQVIGERDKRMRRTALKALEWTQDNISPNNARYLRNLPSGRVVDDVFIMVHGSLVERDAYILNSREVQRNLECMVNEFEGLRICFFAHTHVPMLIGTRAVVTDLKKTRTFQLDRDDIYLINPGSVGQPRDRCPLASFGIFDAERWTMTFVRKEYDLKLAQRRIIEAGLPEKFARRLALGV